MKSKVIFDIFIHCKQNTTRVQHPDEPQKAVIIDMMELLPKSVKVTVFCVIKSTYMATKNEGKFILSLQESQGASCSLYRAPIKAVFHPYVNNLCFAVNLVVSLGVPH